MDAPAVVAQDLVLVGGGHTHALLARRLAMSPVTGLRVTMISDASHAAYSGMLPGLIAGFYRYDDAHIDLRRLCEAAGIRFVRASVTGLDVKQKFVCMTDRPPLAYDTLSLNIGSAPRLAGVPGADRFAIPAKPVPELLAAWDAIVAAPAAAPARRVTIVGGGAGGVELALCIRGRLGDGARITLLEREPRLLGQHNARARRLLAAALREKGIAVRTDAPVAAAERDAVVLENGERLPHDHLLWVTSPGPHAWLAGSGLPLAADGFLSVEPTLQVLGFKDIFAAGDTATVRGAARPKAGVFAVRQAVALDTNLRRHLYGEELVPYRPQRAFLSLIGTGDRSAVGARGVFAGRSRLLWMLKDSIDRDFMRSFAAMTPMRTRIQRLDPYGVVAAARLRGGDAGATLAGGDGSSARDGAPARLFVAASGFTATSPPAAAPLAATALAHAGGSDATSPPVAPPLAATALAHASGSDATSPPAAPPLAATAFAHASGSGATSPPAAPPPLAATAAALAQRAAIRCHGCAGKVGGAVLARALARVRADFPPGAAAAPGIVIGLDRPDDAAVLEVPPGQLLVQSTDYLTALVSDPFTFGRIAATHAFSDIHAMGAKPHSLLATLHVPLAADRPLAEDVYQLLSGIVVAARQLGATLIGGHTSEAGELGIGLTVNGFAPRAALATKAGLAPGDELILTKALGTGTLFAAAMRLEAKGRWLDAAIDAMLVSNAAAAAVLSAHGAAAMTDVTGFGLAGHLHELLAPAGLGAALALDALPVLPGAAATIRRVRSTLHAANARSAVVTGDASHANFPLLFDPQTSGGLLAGVPAAQAAACVAALRATGLPAAVIGHVLPPREGDPWIEVS